MRTLPTPPYTLVALMDEIRPLPPPTRDPPEDFTEDEERDINVFEVMLDGVFLLLSEESDNLQESPPI